MKKQNKYSIAKFSLKLGVILSLVIAPLSLKAKAQIILLTNHNKYNSHLFSVDKSQITVQTQEENQQTEEEPLDFSSSGRSGQQTAGESRGSCSQKNFPLAAIAPKSNESKTRETHPRWWFFLPYESSKISQIEFVLQDEQRNDLVRSTVLTPENLPYFSVTIPRNLPGLQNNLWYRWYLKVYCRGEQDSVPLFVSGWVQKVTLEPSTDNITSQSFLSPADYAKQGLWLEAIDLLMKNQISNASASSVSLGWQKMMNSPEIDLKLPPPATANIVIKENLLK